MLRASFAGAVIAFSLFVGGCQVIAGLEDRTLVDASTHDAKPTEAGSDANEPDTSTCEQCGGSSCIDLVNDANNCGYCKRACQGCAAGKCPVTAVATFNQATALVDDANNLYVSTATNIYAVRKSDNKKTVISNFTANSIAVAAGRLYFTDSYGVWDVAITGGNTEHQIYKRASLGGTAPLNHRLAIDPPNVFWITKPSSFSQRTAMFKVAYDGGGLTEVLLEDAGHAPQALALDSDNVYYTDTLQSGAGVLRKVSRAGGASTQLGASFYAPYDLALTSNNSVVWGTSQELHESFFDGGNRAPIVASAVVINVVVVGTRAYWLDVVSASDGKMFDEVQSTELGTRATTVLATNVNPPANPVLPSPPTLAVDDQFVYWLDGADVSTLMKTAR